MTLSTLNFEYALQLQRTNMIYFRYASNAFIPVFAIPKSIFNSQDS